MPELATPQPQLPAEQPRALPENHRGAQKVGAVLAPAVLLLANNIPGVGHSSEQQVSTQKTVVVESSQVPVTLPAPEDTTITLKPDVNNEYRVNFQTTEGDAVSSESQTTSQLEDVLGADGWGRVYDIQVTGMASAEDEQPGGGLQTASDSNTNLALQRALLAAKPVVDSFAKHGIDVHKAVEKTEGKPSEEMLQVHGVEDQWSDDDMKVASDFAKQFGYASVEDMVVHHNDGGTPPAVDEFLKPLLEDHRGAEITLKLRDDGGGERTVLVTVENKRTVVKDVTKEIPVTNIVTNNIEGNIPEHEEVPKPGPGEDEQKQQHSSTTVSTPPAEGTPIVVNPPNPPKPWEQAPKDAMYRTKQRAPRGNGAKPLQFGGGVPFNPTPSNFPR